MADELPEPVRQRARVSYWLERGNIPKNMWSLSWEKFEGLATEDAAALAEDLASTWVEENGFRGLALFGPPGAGKTTVLATMLAVLIRKTMPTTISRLFSEDVQGYFITLAEYHRLYLRSYELDRWAQRDPSSTGEIFDEWAKNYELRRFIEEEVPHLVLDDVGKEHTTSSGAVEDEFHALIRGRFARGLSTSITSNLTMQGFAKAYGEAQLSFIQEACHVEYVEGPDLREEI